MRKTQALLLPFCLLALAATTPSAHAGDISCDMRYSLAGWSIFYQTAKGQGEITCSNGQSMHVELRTKGGGLTIGKSEIKDGRGHFTGVSNIREVLGSYATAQVHAGVVKSSSAQVLTKGNVALALAGVGDGWDLGIAFGKFEILAH